MSHEKYSNYEYHILYSSLTLKNKLAEQIYEKLYVWVKQFKTSLNIIIIILFRHCYDLVSMDRWILMIFYIWWYVVFQIWPRITRQLTILFVGDTIIRVGNLYQYKSTRIPLGVQYCVPVLSSGYSCGTSPPLSFFNLCWFPCLHNLWPKLVLSFIKLAILYGCRALYCTSLFYLFVFCKTLLRSCLFLI